MIRANGLVVKVTLRWVAGSRATWVLFLKSAEIHACLSHFCVSPSVHWHARILYCCALYNLFFLGFRQWRSRADRVVNLNTTIQLPLFWRTSTRARARTRPHVWAWQMGRDYSDCRASELTDLQVSATQWLRIFLIPRKYRKNEGSCPGLDCSLLHVDNVA